jgi:N-acetylglucosamine kinase-like BadF-type ATPase
VKTFLGVDGGGSKTLFLLCDERGHILAAHADGPAYYLQTGLEALQSMLRRGIEETLRQGGVAARDLTFSFFGLPSYGEDQSLLATLDQLPATLLPAARFRCGNDMVCGWAGALAGQDGINVVAGTGSIAYGECAGASARAGGWGELFGDEGSAYWLAREGLTLFSRMSDGRNARGALHKLVRRHFALENDLDLCAAVYGKSVAQRSQLAQLSKLVGEASRAGDAQARALFGRAAHELADIVDAVRTQLGVLPQRELTVSCSGGLFGEPDLLLEPLREVLAKRAYSYRVAEARLPPEAGAALYAAKISGNPLAEGAIAALERTCRSTSSGHGS